MVEVKKALVVGGGIGGMSTAVRLRHIGIEVDVVEIDPEWRVYGAGITITGPTLRAFRTLGILDDVLEWGFYIKGLRIFNYDGTPVREMEQPVLEPGLPPTGAILRPVLHKILSKRTIDSGANVQLGVSISALYQDQNQVAVEFTNGSKGNYDLVVGADGLQSRTRRIVFPNAPKPSFSGQGCWRVLAGRAPELDWSEFYVGLETRVGINPVSKDQVYLYALTTMQPNHFIEPAIQMDILRDYLAPFGGHVAEIREGLNEQSSLVYRPLDTLLLERPWHLGHIILLGDASHATTPHLASGAGMAVEDAIVLTEELTKSDSIEEALRRFEERRWERCRFVVHNSVQLGKMEMAKTDPREHARLFEASQQALAETI